MKLVSSFPSLPTSSCPPTAEGRWGSVLHFHALHVFCTALATVKQRWTKTTKQPTYHRHFTGKSGSSLHHFAEAASEVCDWSAAAECMCWGTTGTAQPCPETSLLTSAIPEVNQNQAAATKPTWIVTAAAYFLDANKYFVIPILLPTKDVSEAYSENRPASRKQEVGRDSITQDIRAYSPLNFARS